MAIDKSAIGRRFAGKVVIVTGAASARGIGFAAARRVALEGGRVVLTDRDEAGVEQRVAELRGEGAEALAVAHDVADEASWDAVIERTIAEFGRLDGLVNNAGIVLLAPIEEATNEQWDRQIDVNLKGTFLGCRAAIARMRAQGVGGAIVNVSLAAGLIGMRRTSGYTASKGGVRLMGKGLAIETGLDRIRINSVHPGVIETEIQGVARASDPGASAAVAASVPLGFTGNGDHLGAAIAFLLSDDAAYITGTELAVDGGLTAQ